MRRNSSFKRKAGCVYINGGAYGGKVTVVNVSLDGESFVSAECDEQVIKPRETITIPEKAARTLVWSSLDFMSPVREAE